MPIAITVRRPMRLIRFMGAEKITLVVGAQALDREQLDLAAGAHDRACDAARFAVLERAGDRSAAAAQVTGGDDDGGSQNRVTVTCP